MRRLKIGAAPVQVIERAPSIAVAVLGLLFLDVVLLQDGAPARTGVDQLRFVATTRSKRAANHNRLQFLRAEHRAAAMSGKVIVVVGEHGGAIEIFAGRAD